MNVRLHLTFLHDRVAAPVICEVAKKFDVVYSIRRANVSHDAGWMDLEMSGEEAEINRAIAYIQQSDVRVDPLEGDIIAG